MENKLHNMEFVFDKTKKEVLDILKSHINSNNRYVGEGYKISGKISDDTIYLSLEDRNDKSSKFMNEVFSGKIVEGDGKTILKGKFKIDVYPLILLLVLIGFALESLVVSLIFYGLNSGIILPVIVIIAVVWYFVSMKKRSVLTNSYITKYLESI